MLPYTRNYIEHIDDNINDFKYYTFTPRSLMHGDMYKMDDELSALLILKECVYFRMIDYGCPGFQETLASYGSGKGDILHQSIILNQLIRQPDIRRFHLQI